MIECCGYPMFRRWEACFWDCLNCGRTVSDEQLHAPALVEPDYAMREVSRFMIFQDRARGLIDAIYDDMRAEARDIGR